MKKKIKVRFVGNCHAHKKPATMMGWDGKKYICKHEELKNKKYERRNK